MGEAIGKNVATAMMKTCKDFPSMQICNSCRANIEKPWHNRICLIKLYMERMLMTMYFSYYADKRNSYAMDYRMDSHKPYFMAAIELLYDNPHSWAKKWKVWRLLQ